MFYSHIKKNEHSAVTGRNILQILITSSWMVVLFKLSLCNISNYNFGYVCFSLKAYQFPPPALWSSAILLQQRPRNSSGSMLLPSWDSLCFLFPRFSHSFFIVLLWKPLFHGFSGFYCNCFRWEGKSNVCGCFLTRSRSLPKPHF